MISRASISAFNHLPLSEADEGDGLDADAEDEDLADLDAGDEAIGDEEDIQEKDK